MLVQAPGSGLRRSKGEHNVDQAKMGLWAYRIQCHYLQERGSVDSSCDWDLLGAVYFLQYLRRLVSWASGCVHPVHSVVVERIAMAPPAQFRYAGKVFDHCTDIYSQKG
jgi:hypothetical protein